MPSCHRSGVNIAIPIGANAVVPIHRCYSHCTMLTCCHCCGVNVIITVYNCCCCYSQRLPTLSECYHCVYFVQLNFATVILICLIAAVCNTVLMCINVVVAMCNIDVTKCLQCFSNGYTNNTATPGKYWCTQPPQQCCHSCSKCWDTPAAITRSKQKLLAAPSLFLLDENDLLAVGSTQ